MTVDGTQRRMDLVVYTATRTFWFDVSVVNPMCETYAGMNAIEVRRSQKEGKWKKHADKQGVVFRALVFDAFGGTGPDVEKTLATIAAKAHQQAVHPCGSPSRWRGGVQSAATLPLSDDSGLRQPPHVGGGDSGE